MATDATTQRKLNEMREAASRLARAALKLLDTAEEAQREGFADGVDLRSLPLAAQADDVATALAAYRTVAGGAVKQDVDEVAPAPADVAPVDVPPVDATPGDQS